jgi:hypothetical protein
MMTTMLGFFAPPCVIGAVCAVAQPGRTNVASATLPTIPNVRNSRAERLKSSTHSRVEMAGMGFIFSPFFVGLFSSGFAADLFLPF